MVAQPCVARCTFELQVLFLVNSKGISLWYFEDTVHEQHNHTLSPPWHRKVARSKKVYSTLTLAAPRSCSSDQSCHVSQLQNPLDNDFDTEVENILKIPWKAFLLSVSYRCSNEFKLCSPGLEKTSLLPPASLRPLPSAGRKVVGFLPERQWNMGYTPLKSSSSKTLASLANNEPTLVNAHTLIYSSSATSSIRVFAHVALQTPSLALFDFVVEYCSWKVTVEPSFISWLTRVWRYLKCNGHLLVYHDTSWKEKTMPNTVQPYGEWGVRSNRSSN